MGLVHSSWINAGNGILLQHHNSNVSTTDFMELCRKIHSHDMLYILIQQPENFPATVDLGIGPHIIRQADRDDATLLAQVTHLQILSGYVQMHCDCHDEINDDWYTIKIIVDRDDLSKTEVELFMRLEPIKGFGAPAPDMKRAFAEYRRKMHAPD